MSHAQSGIPDHTPSWWSLALRGLVAVLFGLAALFWPGLVLEVLILFFGAYALVDGIFALVAAFGSSGRGMRRPLLLIEGGSVSCSASSPCFGRSHRPYAALHHRLLGHLQWH